MSTTHRRNTPAASPLWADAVPRPGSTFEQAVNRANRKGLGDRYAERILSEELTGAEGNRAFYAEVETTYNVRMDLVRP